MSRMRAALPRVFGAKATALQAEINHYYDVAKCGIGWHGDSERKIVVCARLGAAMPMAFQWYQEGKAIGRMFTLTLAHGGVYAMSQKATGHDWKKRKVATLRHAAGCAAFLTPKHLKPPASKRTPAAASASAGSARARATVTEHM